jgi:hypothetical protein
MKSFSHLASMIGFGLTSAFAVTEKWSLQDSVGALGWRGLFIHGRA